MIITEKATKVIKWIAYIIQVAMISAIIGLSVVCGHQAKAIKKQEVQVKQLTEHVEYLKEENKALGAEDCLTVTCNFNLTQKNILSFTQQNLQNIAKNISTMTRKEIYDSVYAVRKIHPELNDGTVQPK